MVVLCLLLADLAGERPEQGVKLCGNVLPIKLLHEFVPLVLNATLANIDMLDKLSPSREGPVQVPYTVEPSGSAPPSVITKDIQSATPWSIGQSVNVSALSVSSSGSKLRQ